MRRVLRSVRVPLSQHPDRYRASTLAAWFWCAEKSRHYALNLLPPTPPSKRMEIGKELDLILKEKLGRRFPWEEEFMDQLEMQQDSKLGFARKLKTPIGETDIYANITGHPDDFQVSLDGEVSILEYKTTEIGKREKDRRFLEHYRLPMAEFQVKIYCWIFDNIIGKMENYRLGRTHAVLYWLVSKKENYVQLINVYPYTYYSKSVENDIKYAVEAYNKPEMIIKPRPWKCKQCPKIHKAVCQFEQAS